VGLGSISLTSSCSQSSGADRDFWVDKANSAVFSSEAQLLTLLNCRCSKGSGTNQISESRWWLSAILSLLPCCSRTTAHDIKCILPKTASLCQRGDTWVGKGKKKIMLEENKNSAYLRLWEPKYFTAAQQWYTYRVISAVEKLPARIIHS